MIKELLYQLYTAYRLFAGEGAVTVLYIAAAAVLFFVSVKRGKNGAPAILSVFGTIGAGFATLCEEAVSRQKKRGYACAAGLFALALCVLAITSSGKNVFSSELSERAENDMHIPPGLNEAMDAVISDTGSPRVAVMPGWGLYFEGYSSCFDLMYEEPKNGDISSFSDEQRTVYTQLSDVHPDMRKVALAAKRAGCGYIVMSKSIWPKVPINGCGYELLFENDECLVYREVNTP